MTSNDESYSASGKLKFSAQQRLKSTAQFSSVFKAKHSSATHNLIVYASPNNKPFSRLGVSVSKKVGNAVARNRHKRTLREAFRHLQHQLPKGYDFIFIPRGITYPTTAAYQKSAQALCVRIIKKIQRKNKQQKTNHVDTK